MPRDSRRALGQTCENPGTAARCCATGAGSCTAGPVSPPAPLPSTAALQGPRPPTTNTTTHIHTENIESSILPPPPPPHPHHHHHHHTCTHPAQAHRYLMSFRSNSLNSAVAFSSSVAMAWCSPFTLLYLRGAGQATATQGLTSSCATSPEIWMPAEAGQRQRCASVSTLVLACPQRCAARPSPALSHPISTPGPHPPTSARAP